MSEDPLDEGTTKADAKLSRTCPDCGAFDLIGFHRCEPRRAMECSSCGAGQVGPPGVWVATHRCEDAQRERFERKLMAAGQAKLEQYMRGHVMALGRAPGPVPFGQDDFTALLALWMHFKA